MVTMEGYVVVMLGEYKLEGCAGTSATEILSDIATDSALYSTVLERKSYCTYRSE